MEMQHFFPAYSTPRYESHNTKIHIPYFLVKSIESLKECIFALSKSPDSYLALLLITDAMV